MGHNFNLKICITKEITTKWKGSLLNGRRYLYVICLIRSLYSKYIKNDNSMRKRTRWIAISQNNTPCENMQFHSQSLIFIKKGNLTPNEIPFFTHLSGKYFRLVISSVDKIKNWWRPLIKRIWFWGEHFSSIYLHLKWHILWPSNYTVRFLS